MASTITLGNRLSAAAGFLLGHGHRDSHDAVLEALDLLDAAGFDIEQHIAAIEKERGQTFYSPERGAIAQAMLASFAAGQLAARSKPPVLKITKTGRMIETEPCAAAFDLPSGEYELYVRGAE